MTRSIRDEITLNIRDILDRNIDVIQVPENMRRSDLEEAMNYICLSAGNLLRPRLVWAASHDCGGDRATALYYGAALEVTHCGTLGIDDLPEQDNALKRRGKPSCWKHFFDKRKLQLVQENRLEEGEAEQEALKYAVNLTRFAVDMIHRKRNDYVSKGPALNGQNDRISSKLGGVESVLIRGQMTDLYGTSELIKLSDFSELYKQKTGVLFGASAAIGAILAGRGDSVVDRWQDLGINLGVSYQAGDDLVELMGEEIMQKSVEEYGKKRIIFDAGNLGEVVELRESFVARSRAILNELGGDGVRLVSRYFNMMDNLFMERFNYDKALEGYKRLKEMRKAG